MDGSFWAHRFGFYFLFCLVLSAVLQSFLVGAWCSDPSTHVLSFGFVSGFGHSRSMFCLVCGSVRPRVHSAVCSSVSISCDVLCSTSLVFPSLPSFAPYLFSLCLQSRASSSLNVPCRVHCPASQLSCQLCFLLLGSFVCFVSAVNKPLIFLQYWVLAPFFTHNLDWNNLL